MTQYYLEQNYAHPPPSLVIKKFSTKEIISIIKASKTKSRMSLKKFLSNFKS